MDVTHCRVCGGSFYEQPLLEYKNMPKAAQFMPTKAELDTDQGVELDVYQCSGCGLVQLSNEPVPYYKDVIRATAFSAEMGLFRRKQFGEFVQSCSLAGKKLLEVGCGKGEFLSLMCEQDVEGWGIENRRESVEICAANGLNVVEGYIDSEDYSIEAGPFDAFMIVNFCEHMPQLNTVLRGLRNNLKDDAVGLIEVPNFDLTLEEQLFTEFINDHIFYFDARTLRFALEANGFEVLETSEVWSRQMISCVVRPRKKMDLSGFEENRKVRRCSLDDFIGKFGAGKVAVWGAGHQSLSLIALTEIHHTVRCVIDSAPFKQGRYTQATHLPIFSPDILERGELDAVIVIAAAYADEIVASIQQKYGNEIAVAILRDNGLEVLGSE